MNKNTVLAVVLSVIFLILWDRFYQVPRQLALNQQSSQQQAVSDVPSKMASEATMGATETKAPSTPAKRITVELKEAKIVFSEAGGGIEKYQLLLNGGAELVLPGSSFFTMYPESPAKLLLFGNYVLSRQIIDGIILEKRFFFSESNLTRLGIKLTNPGDVSREVEFKMKFSDGIAGDEKDPKANIDANKIQFLADGIRSTVNSGVRPLKGAKWVANDNRHFYLALISEEQFGDKQIEVTAKTRTSPPVAYMPMKLDLAARSSKEYSYLISAGGKSYSELKELGVGLERIVDFGLMGDLGKFFLSALIWLNKFTNNFGWAIVLLSLGIQLITLPLSLKSLKATTAMRKIQPHMREIQQKYKNDPKRMNVEVMNLYKTHHVNPLSGCLPMLLQMPIFWALFTTLQNAFELRNAGWIFWLKDLSSYDPYYVLPILMGIGMFAQQIFSGAASDPQNKMMSYIFPAVFTFMSIRFPSGVVLYWLINSVVNILMQFLLIEKEVIKEHRVAKS